MFGLFPLLFLTVHSEYTPQPSDSRFGWITNFRGLNDDHILMHSSLDNYLFLRLFKILFVISLVGAIITWPILFPVNATGKHTFGFGEFASF